VSVPIFRVADGRRGAAYCALFGQGKPRLPLLYNDGFGAGETTLKTSLTPYVLESIPTLMLSAALDITSSGKLARVAMLKYGIDDIRLFHANDPRFLQQFP
jgi:tRNA synthetases class II core domain (F)